MANYDMMIYYINSIDNNIKELQKKPGSEAIVKKLIKLQEYTKAEWAKIHSICKTLSKSSTEDKFKKLKVVIDSNFNMNLVINSYYDGVYKLCQSKERRGNNWFIKYLFEEIYFNYTTYLDALHNMGSYYVPAQTFPFILADVYQSRRVDMFIANRLKQLEADDDPT
jgi:hypothetical protein